MFPFILSEENGESHGEWLEEWKILGTQEGDSSCKCWSIIEKISITRHLITGSISKCKSTL